MSLQVDGKTTGYKRLASKVLASIKKHRDLMGLQGWDIFVEFGEIKEKKDEAAMSMETLAEPEYYKTTICVDLDRLHEIDIDMYVRHEFIHTILWMYTHAAEELCLKKAQGTILKLEERVVSDLERMPLWDILYKKK